MAHSRRFLADQKARNAIVEAENLLRRVTSRLQGLSPILLIRKVEGYKRNTSF